MSRSSTSKSGTVESAKAKESHKPKFPGTEGNKEYVFCLSAPLLFTAPHGIGLWRGGQGGRKRLKHVRELLVTEITLRLARHAVNAFGAPGSFMVWDTRYVKSYDPKNLDPNYLTQDQFEMSPWHSAVKAFENFGREANLPLFHVDVHGKKDGNAQISLDIGFGSLDHHWKDRTFVSDMKRCTGRLFTGCFNLMGSVEGGVQFSVNTDPRLSGNWKDQELYSMSCQSVCLGIPSLQLEIPKSMRKKLIEDDNFFTHFGDCILAIYQSIVCKDRIIPRVVCDRQFLSQIDVDKLLADLIDFERNMKERRI